MRGVLAGIVLATGLVAAACGTAREAAPPSSPSPSPSREPSREPSPSPSASPSPDPAPVAALSPTPAAVAPTPAAAPSKSVAPAAPVACAVPAGVTAAQVVLVDGNGTRASVRGCVRSASGYVTALGPYAGHVGRSGVGVTKREGDGKTPAGVFPLRGGFGTVPNPGLAAGWFVTDASDVWVDDPASALYNTHQRKPVAGRWTSAEDLRISAYRYAQVIGYNEAHTPGLGSAIFLHVDSGGATAGCVALPTASLLAVLRWQRPGAVIAITI